MTGGKQRRMVQARSVLCYWAMRELGVSAVSISKKLDIASSTASESALRGRQIVEKHGLKLLKEEKSENPRSVPQYRTSLISELHSETLISFFVKFYNNLKNLPDKNGFGLIR